MTTTRALDTHLKKAFQVPRKGNPREFNLHSIQSECFYLPHAQVSGKWKIIMNSIHANKSHMCISSSSTEMAVNNLSKGEADFEEFTPEKVRKVERTNNKYLE